MRGSAHDLAFLIVEHAFESVGVDDLFALIGRHGRKVADCGSNHALPVRRQLPQLIANLQSLLLLLGSQMLPGFHAVQHLQLLLRREIGETLQTLAQQLLPLGRQSPECRIALQGFFLLRRWKIFVAAKPIPGVPLLSWVRLLTWRLLALRRRRCWMLLLNLAEDSSLRKAGQRKCHGDRQQGSRPVTRYFSPPPHSYSFV